MKSATAAVAANEFQKTVLFLCNRHILHERYPGRISAQQHQLFAGNFCAMFQHWRSTAYQERHKSTGPNQQSLSLPQKNITVIVLSSDISPVPDTFCRKQEQPPKHEQSRKGSAAIWTSSPYKNKLQEDRKKKETRDQRKSSSKIRLQKKRQSGPSDANVSVIRGEHEKNRVFIRRM